MAVRNAGRCTRRRLGTITSVPEADIDVMVNGSVMQTKVTEAREGSSPSTINQSTEARFIKPRASSVSARRHAPLVFGVRAGQGNLASGAAGGSPAPIPVAQGVHRLLKPKARGSSPLVRYPPGAPVFTRRRGVSNLPPLNFPRHARKAGGFSSPTARPERAFTCPYRYHIDSYSRLFHKRRDLISLIFWRAP